MLYSRRRLILLKVHTHTHTNTHAPLSICRGAIRHALLPHPPAPPPPHPSGLTEEQAAWVASSIGLSGSFHEQAVDQFMKLYRIFTERDATMVEINPMTKDSSGKGKRRHWATAGWAVL